jgi:hypothetical protein
MLKHEKAKKGRQKNWGEELTTNHKNSPKMIFSK